MDMVEGGKNTNDLGFPELFFFFFALLTQLVHLQVRIFRNTS